jgi:microcystin-dependent protein
MSAPFIAEIRIWGCNFAPTGWAACDGQIMSIAQNTALYSLLGVSFGGNGQTTFGLPDLRNSVPVHVGNSQPGPGLSTYVVGQVGGVPGVTLDQNSMAKHGHAFMASNADSIAQGPTANLMAGGVGGVSMYAAPGAVVQLNQSAVGFIGGSGPHTNMMPFLVLNFCIALTGIFPARG